MEPTKPPVDTSRLAQALEYLDSLGGPKDIKEGILAMQERRAPSGGMPMAQQERSGGRDWRYYAGPHLSKSLDNLGGLASALINYVGPGADVKGMVDDSAETMEALRSGDYLSAAANFGMAAAALPMMFLPGTVGGVKEGVKSVTNVVKGADDVPRRRPGIGHNRPPRAKPTMTDVLNARALEMDKKPINRIQPTPGGPRYFAETIPDYERTQAMMPKGVDISTTYPYGAPGKALPKGGRANVFTEYGDSIAEGLADRMRPYMDNPVRYFYHTGPLYEGALKAGLTPAEAQLWLKDFGNAYAATSPRTTTDINLRNASLLMSKRAAGIDLNKVLGPGTIGADLEKGISERGYPMMTGKSGIHGQLAAALEKGGISRATNTKPSVFAENSAGNLSGVTVDTHAIRGALDVLNEKHPGAIPLEYIKKKYQKAYQLDPTKMNAANWLEDTVASQAFKKAKSQVEYGHVASVYHKAADILGVAPAEAQAMGWFGSGPRTGLSSQQKTIVNLMNDRIDVTAKTLKISQEQAAKLLFRREIPLLSAAGIVATGVANKEFE